MKLLIELVVYLFIKFLADYLLADSFCTTVLKLRKAIRQFKENNGGRSAYLSANPINKNYEIISDLAIR
jgi:hypothetical protein